jgi:hypothetical protein
VAGQAEWDWKRIGKEVQLRRGELGYRRRDDFLTKHPDVKQTFLAELEQGKAGERRSANLAVLAIALGWRRDAFERLGRGEEPDAVELVDRVSALEERLDRVEEKLDQLLEER